MTLLETLMKELNCSKILSEPPKDSVNFEMLAEAIGVCPERAKNILRQKESDGLLKRVRVKVPGKMQPQSYYIEVK